MRLAIVIGGGVSIFYLALVWWCANEMASPPRRAVNASHLAYSVSKPAGLVYGWRTGVRVSDIDSSEKARRIRIPTLVVHGDADGMVPTASGKALFDAIPDATEKRWIEVPGAGHQNVLVTDFPIYATMARWFLEHAGLAPNR